MFTKEFLNVDLEIIAAEIKTNGFFSFENAFTKSFIDGIESDVARAGFTFNKNGIGSVFFETQLYLTHMLTVSKFFFDYITHSKILSVSRRIMGEKFRLKALRYYETHGGHHMQWHTDNKTDRGFAHIPGIIFIAYISDVYDGEFQYIRGSHNWSGESAYSDYTEEFIEKNHKENLVSFKMPKGSLIIYDTYGIHRAKPVSDLSFVRKSLFHQVDAELDDSEPILINTEYLTELDELKKQYLGFGMKGRYEVYPTTILKNVPLTKDIFFLVVGWIKYRLLKSVYQKLPRALKRTFKKS